MVAWYYKNQGIEQGPFTQEKLVRLARQGRIGPDDLVRNELKEKWYKASQVEGLLEESEDSSGSAGKADGADSSNPTTSFEAQRLLKAFRKSKSDSPEDHSTREYSDDSPHSKTAQRVALLSAPTKALARGPLTKAQKLVVAFTGVVAALVILFPSFVVPYGLDDEAGYQRAFLFSPPLFKADAPPKGLKGVKLGSSKVVIFGKKVLGPKSVSIVRLLLELGGVLAVGGTLFVVLRSGEAGEPARAAVAPKRKPQTV